MEDNERWKELCALASKEQDPDKLLALVEEINRLLSPSRLLGQANSLATGSGHGVP
jgi:hypothetical protein